MKLIIDIPERDYDLACKYPNALIATYAHYIKDGTPYEERPHGEWINQSQGAKYPCECSECHTEPFCNDEGYVLSDFCPKCGAKMTKGAENDLV